MQPYKFSYIHNFRFAGFLLHVNDIRGAWMRNEEDANASPSRQCFPKRENCFRGARYRAVEIRRETIYSYSDSDEYFDHTRNWFRRVENAPPRCNKPVSNANGDFT